jgi:hypothetical protein
MKAPSVVALTVASVLATGAAQAQGALVPTKEWSMAPVITMWNFGTAIAQTAGDISDVTQVAIPLRARLRFANAWRVDLNGAFSQSTVSVKRTGSSSLTLSGLSDINVRLTGPVAGGLHLTAGATLPTGKTELGGDEMAALQVIAAPALSMPVASMGLGFSGTLGLLGARQFGEWALALGASFEQRGEYTPVALALSSGESRTTLKPGAATHASFGADRSFGNQRLSFLVVTDVYGEDNLTTGVGSATSTSAYTLGPQVTAVTRLDFAASGWRETMMSASFRQRSAYTDNLGASVEGSSASYLEASIGGVRGEVARRGLILGADARFQSGLDFTNALVGAAVTAAGATVGVDWPFAEANLRVAFRFQAGSLKSGDKSSSITGMQLSGSLSARGGSR